MLTCCPSCGVVRLVIAVKLVTDQRTLESHFLAKRYTSKIIQVKWLTLLFEPLTSTESVSVNTSFSKPKMISYHLSLCETIN